MTTKVLIVDDSALVRKLFVELLKPHPEFEVVGVATDPYDAREKIKRLHPDVLTLDVEMPRMDGLTFLSNLMRLRPMPVLMVSSLTTEGSEIAMRALELGAVDILNKPQVDLVAGLSALEEELVAKLRAAAQARVQRRVEQQTTGASGAMHLTHGLLAIGASTGGTEAIRSILAAFPPDAPATVITQHLPAQFSRMFVKSLNAGSAVRVKEAESGEELRVGHVYVAPGDHHLEVRRSGARFEARLHQGPRVHRHRPSVDVMFDSLRSASPQNTVAALLTGMGEDGAAGLLRLRQAGARTLVQDEASCVVYGMPKVARQLGAAERVVPLDRMAAALIEACRGRRAS